MKEHLSFCTDSVVTRMEIATPGDLAEASCLNFTEYSCFYSQRCQVFLC